MARSRLKMKLMLTNQSLGTTWTCRNVSPSDATVLGHLMKEAYRNTIDDAGETIDEAIAEAQNMVGGKYGSLMETCSFLIEEANQAICACLITLWQGAPLVADLMTHPHHKNRGMGTYLLRQSINALWAQGYGELYLFVTVGNVKAQHIYENLGFTVVEQI